MRSDFSSFATTIDEFRRELADQLYEFSGKPNTLGLRRDVKSCVDAYLQKVSRFPIPVPRVMVSTRGDGTVSLIVNYHPNDLPEVKRDYARWIARTDHRKIDFHL